MPHCAPRFCWMADCTPFGSFQPIVRFPQPTLFQFAEYASTVPAGTPGAWPSCPMRFCGGVPMPREEQLQPMRPRFHLRLFTAGALEAIRYTFTIASTQKARGADGRGDATSSDVFFPTGKLRARERRFPNRAS